MAGVSGGPSARPHVMRVLGRTPPSRPAGGRLGDHPVRAVPGGYCRCLGRSLPVASYRAARPRWIA